MAKKDWAAILKDEDRIIANSDRWFRYHCYSLENMSEELTYKERSIYIQDDFTEKLLQEDFIDTIRNEKLAYGLRQLTGRQRYERRKHIEGKSFDNCLLFDLAMEPLEETAERLETLMEIGRVLEKLPPLQRWRFIFHFFYGYSYSEIAKMQDCNKSAVMRSVQSALKKIRKNVAA